MISAASALVIVQDAVIATVYIHTCALPESAGVYSTYLSVDTNETEVYRVLALLVPYTLEKLQGLGRTLDSDSACRH